METGEEDRLFLQKSNFQPRNESSDQLKCPICLDFPSSELVNPCSDKSHDPCCKSCLAKYIKYIIDNSHFGSCPSIPCPHYSHSNSNYLPTGADPISSKRRRLLIYNEWKNIVSSEVSDNFSSLASSLLAFLCGGCHALKSLDVGVDERKAVMYFKEYLSSEKENSDSTFDDIMNELSSYSSGCLTVEEIYGKLIKNLLPDLMVQPEPSSLNDSIAWGTFIWVLKAIPDPERRANLHLRYLRDRPRIRTICCNKEHCFKCRVKDFHEGKTCAEMSAHSLDHTIVQCPECGISLAKGDGCNTVQCVCGKQFSWAAEKEKAEKCQQFYELYPDNTSIMCATVLCTGLTSTVARAKAWHSRYRREVDAALYQWFKSTHSTCPSQCCATLSRKTMTEGAREATEIWHKQHTEVVEKCIDQNRLAKECLFLTMVPQVADRPVIAYRLTSVSRRAKELTEGDIRIVTGSETDLGLGWGSLDRQLVDSALMWVTQHKTEYLRGLEERDLRAAQQFLFLFGASPPQRTRPAYIYSPCAFEWHLSSSNADLTYSNSNTTVERAGSISCYPAAFSKLVSERTSFVVMMEAAPLSSNWLTFGLAKVDAIASSSSDGVGRSRNTWGLSDDRSSLTSQAIIAACGTEVGHFRKLRMGDTLSALVDTSEGWCEMSVNDQEFTHRFKIPSGSPDEYCFAMTFANDHKVSIISENCVSTSTTHYVCSHFTSESSSPGDNFEGMLTSEQTLRFNALKKQIRLILTGETGVGGINYSSSSSSSTANMAVKSTSELAVRKEEWVQLCGGGEEEASACFREIQPLLDCVLNVRCSTEWPKEFTFGRLKAPCSWISLVKAASWYRETTDQQQQLQDLDLANNFYMTHGDDAPFIAAITLADYHLSSHRAKQLNGMEDATSTCTSSDGAAALAFMRVFADEADSWYKYNSSLDEPLIGNLQKDCRCLPRHPRQKCWC